MQGHTTILLHDQMCEIKAMLYLQHKVKKTREFRKYGQSLMKVTYFNKRLWNICGCDSLIIEFPITSDSIINYFPHIVSYMQSNHVGNHL